ALSYEGISLSAANHSDQQAQGEFAVRCSMYNLQMRSVLETNEIETTPLRADPDFRRLANEPTTNTPGVVRALGVDNLVVDHNQKGPDALFDYVYGFQKFVPEKLLKPGERAMVKQLLEYDDSRARLPASRRHANSSHPRLHPRDVEEGPRRPLLDDTRLFG